jgi:hypothetical protein
MFGDSLKYFFDSIDPERTAGKIAIAAPPTSNGWIGGHDMKLPRPAPRYGRRS